jgi:glutamine cyclotransferase
MDRSHRLAAASQRIDAESVLNGIAYDSVHDRLFVTGKQWPLVFEIEMVQKTVEKVHLRQRSAEAN